AFHTVAAEAKRERIVKLLAAPDPERLSRILLRLRHDLVMVGRACAEPQDPVIATRLAKPLEDLGRAISDALRASARGLMNRKPSSGMDQVVATLRAYNAEVGALRREGLLRPLDVNDVEHFFALGFAFHQMERNLSDLQNCTREWATAAQ